MDEETEALEDEATGPGESPKAEIQQNDHRGCVPNHPAIPH